jgi:hypothetical protein
LHTPPLTACGPGFQFDSRSRTVRLHILDELDQRGDGLPVGGHALPRSRS